MMAANTKDFRCQKLPNHLQNPHLLRYTLLTVKYTIYSTKGKTMTRIKSEGFIRLFTRFESLGHFSREKNTFWKFLVVVVQKNGKEMYKKVCCTFKVVFLLIRPTDFFFWHFVASLPSITRFSILFE